MSFGSVAERGRISMTRLETANFLPTVLIANENKDMSASEPSFKS